MIQILYLALPACSSVRFVKSCILLFNYYYFFLAFHLTFHDLLQLHLQSLDGSDWILTSLSVYPVDGQLPIGDYGNVIILHVQHLVGVFNDGTVGPDETETCDL